MVKGLNCGAWGPGFDPQPRQDFFSLFYITEFKFEVRCDLWGHLEADRASEATKVPIRGNMHIDTRVIEVADFKYEVRNGLWDY